MSKVNDIIEKGDAIPDDATRVRDCTGDEWRLEAAGWHTGVGSHDAHCAAAAKDVLHFSPLTVTAVREPEPQQAPPRVDPDQCPHGYVRGDHHWYGCVGVTDAEPEPADVTHYHLPGDSSPLTLCGIDIWDESGPSVTEHAGSTTCPACRAAADEGKPAPAPSVLLDLMERYGVEQYSTGYNVRKGDTSAAKRDRAAASALWDRIAALVPQQPDMLRAGLLAVWQDFAFSPDEPDNAALVHWAEALVENGRRDGRAAKAAAVRIDEIRADRDRIVAASDHLMSQMRAERDEARAEVERLTAKLAATQEVVNGFMRAPDPSVLSLPQVPPGAVALIGGTTGAKWVRAFNGEESWRMDSAGEGSPGLPLLEVFRYEGSVTVAMREPRTWPKLYPMPLTVNKVEVHGQGIWKRGGLHGWRQGDESKTTLQLMLMGDVTEVFDNEPGGAA